MKEVLLQDRLERRLQLKLENRFAVQQGNLCGDEEVVDLGEAGRKHKFEI